MTVEELEKGLKSQYWRMSNLYWIINHDGVKVLFKMNYVQYLLYKALWFLNLVLKSRQHGITTFICILFLDTCLFTPNIRAGIICHKLSAAKNIFRTKVKFAYNNLPETLRQHAFFQTLKDDTQEIVFANNSSMYVTASVRSDSVQLLHISEYSWICQHAAQKASEIKSGALPALARDGIAIFECTSEGVGDDFQQMYQLAEGKKERGEKQTRMDYRPFFFPWFFDHANQLFEEVEIPEHFVKYFEKVERIANHKIGPAYRSWYVKTKEVYKELMFKEYPSTSEEAFYASIEGTILGRLMIAAREDERICFVPHDPTYRVYTASDLGTMHTAFIFFQFIANRINIIDFYEDNVGAGAAVHAKVLHTKPYVYSGHCTGPDILGSNKKDATGRMVKDLYAELGINFDVIPDHSPETRIAASRHLIHRCWFDDRQCSMLVKHMMNYHKEKDEIASTEEHTVYKEKPVHDAACHAADAFGHGALQIRMCEENGTVPGGTTKSIVHSQGGYFDGDAAGVADDKMLEV